jgi:hypothetical protein
MINRVIHSDNGTLIDISRKVGKYQSGSHPMTFVAAEDALFIGSLVPFNHLYFKLGTTVNTAASNMSISTWDGSEFKPVVDIQDETETTAPLAQSGHLTWTPNRLHSWHREHTEDNGTERITGLGGITVYDNYWLKITFDADLDAGLEIEWLGQLFSDDEMLGAEYPDLVRSNVLTAFKSGKTDWQEQHVKASEIVIQDLVRKGVILEKGQILDRDKLSLASVSKCAEIIFGAFGDDYAEDKIRARNEYEKRLDLSVYHQDADNDAIIDRSEVGTRTGFLDR